MDKVTTAEQVDQCASRDGGLAKNFRQIAEAIPLLVWSARADGVCDYYNSRFLEFLGQTLDEMHAKTLVEMLHPDDRQRSIDGWTAAISSGSDYYEEYRIRRASDGRYLWHEGRANAICDDAGNIIRWFGTCTEIEGRKQVVERQTLLMESISQLLASRNPQQVIDLLCQNVMALLDCQVFFNFLVDADKKRLLLNACAGISTEEQTKLKWLDYGVAVCGSVARDACRIIAEEIQSTADSRTELVKAYGVRAYACHPLLAQGRVLGTLSFGTRSRDRFCEDDLTLMKTVADHVAIALERSRIENLLRENEERLRLALDAAYVISFEWDIPRNEVRRCVSHEPAFAVTSDEQPGTFEEVVAVVHPDDRELFRANIAAALASENGVYESEHRIVHPDGEIVWLYERGRVSHNEAGQPVRLIGLSQDVSQRKLAEAGLRDSEALYRAIGESINYGVWVCDPEGRNTYASPSFLKLVGLTQEQCSNFGWGAVLHPDDAESTIAAWKECIRTGTAWNIEHRFLGVDGQWHPILARGMPARDDHGNIKFWAGINLDISDLKKTEEALAAAKSAAEMASQAKSDFLANMSHDIRTPMTVFLMALEQLQQIETKPESRQLLELAAKSAKALRELVDDILDISQIEACRVNLSEEPLELRQCVREVAGMFSLAAQEKGMCLTENIAPEVPSVIVADQRRLKQVLINLLGNALKFSTQGGVEVSVSLTGEALRFAVADRGSGIPEDKQQLLFQSFSQVDNSFHRQHGGSGLGLAICKGLVDLMGGTITMRNRKGGGSIFAFTLPLKTVAVKDFPQDAPIDDEGNLPTRPVRILLAEDEPLICDIVSLALTHRGWQVVTAADGLDALAMWQSAPFDVILMDLQMPGMNGLEATRAIRASESGTGRHIAIIGFTAHASEKIIGECIEAGMDYVLSKPFEFDALSEVINQCLEDV